MNFLELSDDQAASLWRSFGNVLGQDELRKMYGDYWPRVPVYAERVWIALTGSSAVGWTSLRPDPVEPIVWMALGIWPEHQEAGNARTVFQWALKRTFAIWPAAEAMFFAVSNANKPLLDYWNKGKVSLVGGIHYPEPGFTYYAVKNRNRGGKGGGAKV